MKLEAKVYRRNKKGEVYERERVLPKQSSTYLAPYSLTSRVESGTQEGLDAALKIVHDAVVQRVNVAEDFPYATGLLKNSIIYTSDGGKTIKGMNEGGNGVKVSEGKYTREVRAGLPTTSKQGVKTGFVGTFVSPSMGEGLPSTIERRVFIYEETGKGKKGREYVDTDYEEIPNPDLDDDYQYASLIEYGGNVRHEYKHADGSTYVRVQHIKPHAFFRGGVDDSIGSGDVVNIIKNAIKNKVKEAIEL